VLRALAPDGGFTLVEMLVATLLALLVLGGTTLMLIRGQVDASSAIARANAVATANAGVRTMDQDLRQAYEVEYPTSTSHGTAGCTTVSAGIQQCNQLDVLARTGAGTDYEVRYDCTVTSTTVATDRACWRYKCAASAATGSASSCLVSTGGVSPGIVIDDVINGTTTARVFSFCYQSSSTSGAACASGATRPTSATVTVLVPAAGTLSTASSGDPATVLLQNGIFMPNLNNGQ